MEPRFSRLIAVTLCAACTVLLTGGCREPARSPARTVETTSPGAPQAETMISAALVSKANGLIEQANTQLTLFQDCVPQLRSQMQMFRRENIQQRTGHLYAAALDAKANLDRCMTYLVSARSKIREAIALPLPEPDRQYLTVVLQAIDENVAGQTVIQTEVWPILFDNAQFLDAAYTMPDVGAALDYAKYGRYTEARRILVEARTHYQQIIVKGEQLAAHMDGMDTWLQFLHRIDEFLATILAAVAAEERGDRYTAAAKIAEAERLLAELNRFRPNDVGVNIDRFPASRKVDDHLTRYFEQRDSARSKYVASQITVNMVHLY